jgi:low affinity Fe/Cu permease
MSDHSLFTRFSHHIAHGAGRPVTFAMACAGIVLWAVLGPIFHFSETWQLVVNTATTIITFLMVFVLQNTQNRDGEAVQAKLDELIIAIREADNRYVGAEQLSAAELKELRAVATTQVEEATEELRDRGVEGSASEPA